MKETIQTIYRCEYCNKLYQRKHACIEHEARCSRNPANDRACFDCKHLDYKMFTILHDGYDGREIEDRVRLLYCNKLEKYVYPPVTEFKGNAIETVDVANDPMPRKCDKQEPYSKIDGSHKGLWDE